tara:strand:- start:298 stop:2379 length:2082 start_codon:yes stop_codon:yes gene_type:complete
MEEINIFLKDKINIFYISLFDDSIKDENKYKVGNYKLENDMLNINYDDGKIDNFKYIKNKDNIKYFGELIDVSINNKIHICHEYWEDELRIDNNLCYRSNNHDKGKFVINNDELNIKWDNYDNEKFILNKNDNKYYFKNNKKTNKKKIIIKNLSWENDIILDFENNICNRLNEQKDKGKFKLEGNYLFIDWYDWDSETFYNIDNIYYNNKKFIKNSKFISIHDVSNYEYDKEYIYINDNKYKFILDNKKIIIDDYEYGEFIMLDNEYYFIDYFEKYNLDNITLLFFKNENIIFNNLHNIIGNYQKINNIFKIEWYNHEVNFYKNETNNLYKLELIKLKDNNIKNYYLYKDQLYDNNFENIIHFEYLNESEIILDNNIVYEKENDKYIIKKDLKKKEIIVLEESYNQFYYSNNTLFNTNEKYLCLTDDNFNNIHIKKNGDLIIYKNLYNNIYIKDNDYNFMLEINFNEKIFKYFENEYNENLIEDIKKDNIIYNNKTFKNRYLFFENIDFSNNQDYFNIYGYFIIQEKNMNIKDKIEINIVNLKNNDNFMNNQDLWIDFFNQHNENLIIIFDDFSYYEFLNNIFSFEEKYNNYIILINYNKCEKMIHFYLNNLLNYIDTEKFITKINYVINIEEKNKIVKKIDKLTYDVESLKYIYNITSLIIFIINLYIVNKSLFNMNFNFNTTINNYKKFKI